MNFPCKQSFLNDIETSWDALTELLKRLPDDDLARPGLYAGVRSGVDVLTHIHEWHNMCLRWYQEGLKGTPVMPAPGFKWTESPALNEAICQRYKNSSPADARRKLRASHRKVVKLMESLTERQLLEPGYYAWCGKEIKLPLTSYFHPNTSGHYRWALKKLKRLLTAWPLKVRLRRGRRA